MTRAKIIKKFVFLRMLYLLRASRLMSYVGSSIFNESEIFILFAFMKNELQANFFCSYEIENTKKWNE